MLKNYYQILGLESNASTNEIKKAYRMYASKFHPDKQNGDKFFEERFREINEAYEVLSDFSKRAKYDNERAIIVVKESSDNNKKSYSKYENDLNKDRENNKKTNETKEHETKLRERRAKIFYTSKNLSVNGMYVYIDSKSYLLDKFDSATIRKDDNSNFVFLGIVLIIVGILTFVFFIGAILLAWGIYGLFYKEYFVVLVNEYGDIPLIKGRKQKMRRIASKINQAKKYSSQFSN